MKRFRLLEIIPARLIRKRKIEEKVQSFGLHLNEAIRKAIDYQQGEAKRSYRGFLTVLISIIIIVLLLVLFGREGVLYLFLYCVLLLFIKFMLRCCGDCAFSASFVRECTDVNYVAREGVELTVQKESVFVEEIKKVGLRFRRAQFIYDRNYNRNAVMHLADFR